ncbi:hypothetical protein [Dyadobacter sp.]
MNVKENNPRDGLPPFVNSWRQLYIVMIATLAVLILLFYLFMRHFQ